LKRVAWAAWRRLAALVGPYRCGSCGGRLRRLVEGDLSPEAVRDRRLAGSLGGLLAAGYVCANCTKPGDWILIE
jgi:DNA-directed RNA polymerase subunit RPC12/RpoP